MVKNFGRMHYIEVTIDALPSPLDDSVILVPARTFFKQVNAEGIPWWEISRDIPVKKGQWFIAVNENGFIMMAEKDPTMVSLHDCDIWQIEHPGPDTEIRGHKWTGKKVEPFPEEQA